jgi:hypothetical protein
VATPPWAARGDPNGGSSGKATARRVGARRRRPGAMGCGPDLPVWLRRPNRASPGSWSGDLLAPLSREGRRVFDPIGLANVRLPEPLLHSRFRGPLVQLTERAASSERPSPDLAEEPLRELTPAVICAMEDHAAVRFGAVKLIAAFELNPLFTCPAVIKPLGISSRIHGGLR